MEGGETSTAYGEAQDQTSDTSGRENFLKKEDYFMKMAMLTAERSKDNHTQVGCCIVKDDRIISVGYNSLPKGLSDDDVHWGKRKEDDKTQPQGSDDKTQPQGSDDAKRQKVDEFMKNKYNFVVYAVLNAFVNKLNTDVSGGTLYCTLFPSYECVKIIIQSGIKKVVYYEDNKLSEDEQKAAKRMCDEGKDKDEDKVRVKVEKYEGTKIDVTNKTPQQQSTSESDMTAGRKTCNVSLSDKRKSPLSWDEYFMGVALLTAQRSEDPEKQVGCCIVNPEKRVVGLGYNAMPKESKNFPWIKDDEHKSYEKHKHYYVVHAEFNAINNKITDIKGCKLYCTLHPCNKCAQVIIQSGIKKVVYYDDDKDREVFLAANMMLKKAGIKLKKYKEHQRDILLDLKDKCQQPIQF